jgi:hypothetical protein
MNYMEIIKGLILTLIAILCGLHEASHGGLYVPLVFVMIFPLMAVSTYLAHKQYVDFALRTRFLEGEFTLELRLRGLIEKRAQLTDEEELAKFDAS